MTNLTITFEVTFETLLDLFNEHFQANDIKEEEEIKTRIEKAITEYVHNHQTQK